MVKRSIKRSGYRSFNVTRDGWFQGNTELAQLIAMAELGSVKLLSVVKRRKTRRA